MVPGKPGRVITGQHQNPRMCDVCKPSVAVYVVDHLPATVGRQPAIFADLSPETNSRTR